MPYATRSGVLYGTETTSNAGDTMTTPIRIDFVSDVSCPWCIIGLRGLEEALKRVDDLVEAEIHFQPFELNPQMPPEGQNLVEHVAQKYGSTPQHFKERRAAIRDRAAELGFTIALRRKTAGSTTHSMRIGCCTGPGWRAASTSSSWRFSMPISRTAATPATMRCWPMSREEPVSIGTRPSMCWPPDATPTKCARSSDFGRRRAFMPSPR